ncbi:MAG: WD40 repeat domain-containing protein, partial [Candidatus Eisenbacteria bacterium]|nr:WD40 repeat domain-containing protein [Candidatus Eisenbacteria bacterium]
MRNPLPPVCFADSPRDSGHPPDRSARRAMIALLLPVALALALIPCAAPAGAAAEDPPGRRLILGGDLADRQARTETQAPGAPLLCAEDGTSPGMPSRGGSNEYLWLDTSHLNAIAEEVAITGDGAFGIVGWWLNNERTALYEVSGDNLPEWTRAMPLADFQIRVDADEAGNALVSTARNDSLYVFSAASPQPLHTGWYTDPRVGYGCAVSAGGDTYASVGGHPPGTAGGEIRVYDGGGALRFKAMLSANPEGVAVSADGLVAAANTRTHVKVWDAVTGALRDSVAIPGETQVAAVLSGDGGVLVTGGFSRRVWVHEWDGSDYVQAWSYLIPSTTWISALGISRDGSTIAVGTWTNQNGGQVLVFDRTISTPLWTDAGYGDWVAEVALTPDGGRIAAASWGRLGGSFGPIVSVYERRSATPIYTLGDDAIAGVGSCFSVDISADGTAVLAGGKAVHAREMGSGGWVMAIDLGDPAGLVWTPGDARP